ncbi:MAG: hypothetical protein GY835_22325, partial [bacterium]|nr:hypothetical protein [bacterium]
GRVVLATIRVWSEDVVQVWLKGLDAPLEATADHPVYSVTREAWVGAGKLLAGEEIWALGDTALVLEVDSKRGTYSVFNLEVEGEHVFFVSDLRVLSHNVSSSCPTNDIGDRRAFEGINQRVKVPIERSDNTFDYLIFDPRGRGSQFRSPITGRFVKTPEKHRTLKRSDLVYSTRSVIPEYEQLKRSAEFRRRIETSQSVNNLFDVLLGAGELAVRKRKGI